MIDEAYRSGVNYFDTAYPYHEGMSETFIGRALKKYPRESFFLADKMPGWLLKRSGDGERIFQEQLKKCQVDYFDFYLCHSLMNPDNYISQYEKIDTIEFLRRQMQDGAIRRLGFSFHGTTEDLPRILDRGDWDFVQIQLNYLDWDIQDAKTKYRILEERGIPCIVMEPVRGGNLCTLCEESVRILQEARPDKSVASWAIRFAASLPGVLTVLSGMSSMDQVRDNVDTMNRFEPLSGEERNALERSLDEYLKNGTIPCTGCRYCMDCPHGVDIPGVFSVYNECVTSMRIPIALGSQAVGNREAKAFVKAYEMLPEEKRAENCVACGECMQHCPQSIRIPERMAEITKLISELRSKI
ncbi:aldo/keto reductase [Caproicibacter fermentans]|uniref:Aldo/keto reductase n=2 Tax=Caproicibacter fermentans TaxID=2576756 RepID=A0A7G8TFT5_9FIRM|nr:aldo/keto reductase [Caproicibacter fermentans]